MNPEISVIIAAYNVQDYISHFITSLLNQTFANWEAIIYDDGSTDSTVNVVMNHNDFRIKLIKGCTNQGIGIARQCAFAQSSGKYIYILDADDWIEKDTFEIMLPYMKDNDMCIAGIDGTYHLNKICKSVSSCLWSFSEYPCLINHMIKRDVFIHSNLRKIEDLPSLLKMFTLTKKIIYINKTTYHYSKRLNSVTNTMANTERLIYTALGLIEAFEFNKRIKAHYHFWLRAIQKELQTEVKSKTLDFILNYKI